MGYDIPADHHQSLPDANCLTREDGECISPKPCIHTAPAKTNLAELILSMENQLWHLGKNLGDNASLKQTHENLQIIARAMKQHI